MTPLVLVVGAFVVMEGVSYAAHRWVMHGFAMSWHRSHHAPATSRFERNDLFPVCFSAIGVLLFALGSLGLEAVHEVYIHHRLPIRVPKLRYLEWLRDSHRVHHQTGAEPYGMLLPLVREPSPARTPASDPLERSLGA
jgi:beta-carotene 3-hydroxylase